MYVGMRVQIDGLQSRPDLNGKVGVAAQFDNKRGRYAGDPVHSFAAEEHLMREMSRVGLIKFCSYMDGNTTAALKNNEECGFNPFLLKTKPAVSGQAAVDTALRQNGGDGSGSRVDGVFERLYGENGRDAQHAATAYAKSRTPGAPRPARKSVLDEADGIEG